jgi:hypothetical protein
MPVDGDDLYYVGNRQPTRFLPTNHPSTTDSVINLALTTKELKHQIMFNIIDDDEHAASSDHELCCGKSD